MSEDFEINKRRKLNDDDDEKTVMNYIKEATEHLKKCAYCRAFFSRIYGITNNDFTAVINNIWPCPECGSMNWKWKPDEVNGGPCINRRCQWTITADEARQYNVHDIHSTQLCIAEDPSKENTE
jgi:hypothetical protein